MCNLTSAVKKSRLIDTQTCGLVIQITVRVTSGDLLSLTATRDGDRLKWTYEIGPGANALAAIEPSTLSEGGSVFTA